MIKERLTLVSFISLSDKEVKMVLAWRNSDNIRKWMHNQDSISLNEHLEYLDYLKTTTTKQYFLVKKGNAYLGVIYFTNILDRRVEIGLYANPELKGLGNILMGEICNYSFDKLNVNILCVEVFCDNEKAIKLYNKFGFRETKRKKNDDNEIVYMELKDENR